MKTGYIYIATNSYIPNLVRIGYAPSRTSAVRNLSGAKDLPADFKIYATYKTEDFGLDNKRLCAIIDLINPALRTSKNREFFEMSAEEAYGLLVAIATINKSLDKLELATDCEERFETKSSSRAGKRAPVNFAKCGIPVGAELVYTEDSSIRVIVESDRKVIYNTEITSLSAVVSELKGVKAIQGPSYFTYNGKLITDIAEETQWKN